MQGLLLRFLETGELQKVGADRGGRVVNVRVIAATNRNLRDMIAQGTFREDLFYRLNVIHIVVPPLRERREDIPLLVEHFLDAVHRRERARRSTGIAPDAMKALMRLLLARQRARARERHRAAGRDRPATSTIELEDLPPEIRAQRRRVAPAEARAPPDGGRRSLQAADRGARVVLDGGLSAVHGAGDHARSNVREVVRKGLEEARGNYKIVARLFNMEPRDYKRFLNFLRKHDCQLPFKEFRQ